MASRRTPTPDPGIAGEFGSRAIAGAITFGIIMPVLQYIGWVFLVDMPSSSEVMSQPPHAWVYIAVLVVLPPIAFIMGTAKASTEAGAVGGIAYVLMVLAGQSLFSNPVLSVLIILGLVMGLFVFLALKLAVNNSQWRRRGGRRYY